LVDAFLANARTKTDSLASPEARPLAAREFYGWLELHKSFDQWLMTAFRSLFIMISKAHPKNGVKFSLADGDLTGFTRLGARGDVTNSNREARQFASRPSTFSLLA
jgi:hypothetical protein